MPSLFFLWLSRTLNYPIAQTLQNTTFLRFQANPQKYLQFTLTFKLTLRILFIGTNPNFQRAAASLPLFPFPGLFLPTVSFSERPTEKPNRSQNCTILVQF